MCVKFMCEAVVDVFCGICRIYDYVKFG